VSTSKHSNATSSLKTNFIFVILNIHTIQTIKYHYHTFSLFNSKFKFQVILNHPLPPTFSLISTNITFYIISLSFTLNFFPFFPHFLSHPQTHHNSLIVISNQISSPLFKPNLTLHFFLSLSTIFVHSQIHHFRSSFISLRLCQSASRKRRWKRERRRRRSKVKLWFWNPNPFFSQIRKYPPLGWNLL